MLDKVNILLNTFSLYLLYKKLAVESDMDFKLHYAYHFQSVNKKINEFEIDHWFQLFFVELFSQKRIEAAMPIANHC